MVHFGYVFEFLTSKKKPLLGSFHPDIERENEGKGKRESVKETTVSVSAYVKCYSHVGLG